MDREPGRRQAAHLPNASAASLAIGHATGKFGAVEDAFELREPAASYRGLFCSENGRIRPEQGLRFVSMSQEFVKLRRSDPVQINQ